MSHWKSPSFYAVLLASAAATFIVLGFAVAVACGGPGPEGALEGPELWVVNTATCVLPLVVGFAIALRSRRRREPRGFPVVQKQQSGPGAG